MTPERYARLAAWGRQHCMSKAVRHAKVDDVAVRAAIVGHRHMLTTRAEKVEAVRILTRRGLSTREIATTLGVHPDSVSRYRTKEGRAR